MSRGIYATNFSSTHTMDILKDEQQSAITWQDCSFDTYFNNRDNPCISNQKALFIWLDPSLSLHHKLPSISIRLPDTQNTTSFYNRIHKRYQN